MGVTPKINIHRSGTLPNPLIQSIARAHTHNFPKYSKMDLKNWPLFEVTQQYNGNLLISLLTCFCHIYTQRKRDACHHHLGRRSRLALNINCTVLYTSSTSSTSFHECRKAINKMNLSFDELRPSFTTSNSSIIRHQINCKISEITS